MHLTGIRPKQKEVTKQVGSMFWFILIQNHEEIIEANKCFIIFSLIANEVQKNTASVILIHAKELCCCLYPRG